MTVLGYAKLAWVYPATGLTYCSLLSLNHKCSPKLKTWYQPVVLLRDGRTFKRYNLMKRH